ncbi:putative ribonuclease H-like domain-containing protein [Tanacetum coccineum]
MVPRAVLMKSGLVSLNTARQVNTVHPKITMNSARPMKNLSKTAHSTDKNVNTVRPKAVVNAVRPKAVVNAARPKAVVNAAKPKAVVNAVKGNNVNVVKASACWVWKPKNKVLNHVSKHNNASITLKKFDYVDAQDLQDKGVIDSGCSRHMTGNMSYLTDYEEIDGGYVAFGGNPKGGKITGRGTIKTGNLDFENVYFVKELKFNLFSVSQMCDKKNSVLFNDTECIVLSPNFKLTDESQVLLKVPRKNNMYSVDLKNIVPKGGLTCLFAKATSDESKLWHRRLGHINFKTMNKLVKGNLVRGLPSKLFENNQTCVACQKGKQHRASCKSKTVSSISQPLHMLHMDLFGPTFVKSLMKKMYCLVVTDDYSRFSWVFFLATKDETSGILKSFITGVENLIDQRVKVIRCDNGTEFKNKEMNQFCERKGIKREFSVARTPQQNGVAERKNRTLIEAARTMLADSKLPTTFWAEAVNTACYVQNRVLVTKPHNKTPYELFLGRKPALGFMRPFGCPVTILNTIDHLGKFDGKADEGFFVGYSINSKAFRVFNSRTRIVEENLHVQFSENTPNIAGSGPNWLFDIDALTKSMNYKPVVAGNQSNGNAGTKACDDAGKARMETVPGKDYILLPLWTADPPFSQSSKSSPDAGFKPLGDDEKKKDASVNSTNNVNAASTNEVNAVGRKASIKLLDDPNMPALEDIVYSDDDEDVGAEADMNNLDAFMPVSPIPTTRIHKDHLVEQIIKDLNSAPQTRRMTKSLEEHVEPKKMDVKSDFLYDKIDKEVYVCQPQGFKDPDFLDRVYKVEKALYGMHQAPRAWYETLSTYLLDNGFQRGKIYKTLFIRRDKGDILTELVEGTEMEESSKKAEVMEESSSKEQEMSFNKSLPRSKRWMMIKKELNFKIVLLRRKEPATYQIIRVMEASRLHGYTRPEKGYERVLWGDLKTLVGTLCGGNIRERKCWFGKAFVSELSKLVEGGIVEIKRLLDDLKVTVVKGTMRNLESYSQLHTPVGHPRSDESVTMIRLRRARNRRGRFTFRAEEFGQVATTCEEPSGQVYGQCESLRRAEDRRGRFTSCGGKDCSLVATGRGGKEPSGQMFTDRASNLGKVAERSSEETVGAGFTSCEGEEFGQVATDVRGKPSRGEEFLSSARETWYKSHDVRKEASVARLRRSVGRKLGLKFR